jgi:hypothetical protein
MVHSTPVAAHRRQGSLLGAGYNFLGFDADRSLSGSSDTHQGYYLRLRFKFDEKIFDNLSEK